MTANNSCGGRSLRYGNTREKVLAIDAMACLVEGLGDRLGDEAPLLRLLKDDTIHPDAELPATGVPLEWERLLSAAFILGPSYGTRCSTVVVIDRAGTLTFAAAGACSITASQTGNANFAAATPVTQTFTVLPGANVITFAKPANTPITSAPPGRWPRR